MDDGQLAALEILWRRDSDHSGCARILQDMSAALGVDVTVSTAPPLIAGMTAGYICPHGTRYWIEPTGEQRAEWRRDGVP